MMFLSRTDLEKIAERVLRAYRRLPAAQEIPYRVDPALLAKELLKLTVRYRRLSSDGSVLGLTSYGEVELLLPDAETLGSCVLDGHTILLEEELYYDRAGLGRHNFTLAHECAHHILKMLYPSAYCDTVSGRRVLAYRSHGLQARGGVRDWEEWQMDVLASALLMPHDLLLRNLELAGCPQGIPVLNPVWRREDYARFSGLCRMMGVSREALAYRLQMLGLLGQNQMKNPNAMIDIVCEEVI